MTSIATKGAIPAEKSSRKLKPSSLPFEQRLALSVSETAETLGVGRNSVYGLIKAGRLKAVKLGARNTITTDSIRALLHAEAA
ncbi:MAG: helix-turn-helix domain-containing protein [Pseudolabrys sp.]|nr:helix-turn-helix domain-containing protein [Pseudolabrys sp.]